jgi:hypothetical protein
MGINHVEPHIFVPFALVNSGIARYNIEGRLLTLSWEIFSSFPDFSVPVRGAARFQPVDKKTKEEGRGRVRRPRKKFLAFAAGGQCERFMPSLA